MRPSLAPTLALALLAGTLAGCGSSRMAGPQPGSTGTDQAQVAAVLADQPGVVDDGLADSQSQTTLDSAPTGALALIQPLTYWRTILNVDRTFEFAFADTDSTGHPTTAVVTIRKRLDGRFNILTGTPGTDSTAMDSSLRVVHKPLEDHWVRRVLLKRVAISDSGDVRWRIAATSGVRVTSKNATTHLVSLRVQDGALDTTLTDPLAFFRLRRILALPAGTDVILTATTERNDDVVVLMHRDRRFRFRNNGDDTYTGVWHIGLLADGIQHVGVNAFSHGTLFDDQAPYDSQAWILPYFVGSGEVAEYLQ